MLEHTPIQLKTVYKVGLREVFDDIEIVEELS
jgi:hypothetical protein